MEPRIDADRHGLIAKWIKTKKHKTVNGHTQDVSASALAALAYVRIHPRSKRFNSCRRAQIWDAFTSPQKNQRRAAKVGREQEELKNQQEATEKTENVFSGFTFLNFFLCSLCGLLFNLLFWFRPTAGLGPSVVQ